MSWLGLAILYFFMASREKQELFQTTGKHLK